MIDKIVVEYKDNIKKVACLCEGKLREFFLLDNSIKEDGYDLCVH